MKNWFIFKRAILPAVALCVLATSCDKDDDSNSGTPGAGDSAVIGSYAGVGSMLYLAPQEGEEAPSGDFAVEVQVDADKVVFGNFPIDVIVRTFFEEQIADGILEAVGQIGYEIAYDAVKSESGNLDLELQPEPLVITIPGASEEESGVEVVVAVSAPEKGTYVQDGEALGFMFAVDGVTVGGEPLAQIPVLTFEFQLEKK